MYYIVRPAHRQQENHIFYDLFSGPKSAVQSHHPRGDRRTWGNVERRFSGQQAETGEIRRERIFWNVLDRLTEAGRLSGVTIADDSIRASRPRQRVIVHALWDHVLSSQRAGWGWGFDWAGTRTPYA